jgi:hypothetical protein
VDEGIRKLLAEHPKHLRHLPGVHAKTIFNEAAALVGSANFTKQGFAERDELGCLIRAPYLLESLSEWFEGIWESSKEISQELLNEYVERGQERSKLFQKVPQHKKSMRKEPSPSRSLGWMELTCGEINPSKNAADGHVNLQKITDDSSTNSSAKKQEEDLVDTLRLCRSREEVDLILDLFAEALSVSKLKKDDERLHLNFGPSKKWRISMTVSSRYVAWTNPSIDPKNSFGFIIDDPRIAERLEMRYPERVKAGSFSGSKIPNLSVGLELLESENIRLEIRDSWHKAIRAEVNRAHKNPYKDRHDRPFLYDVLTDPAQRERVVDLAFLPRSWWFGVNNGNHGHIQFKNFSPFLNGIDQTFEWQFGNSKPRELYRYMKTGDRVLIWTGHGQNPQWGLLGTARIMENHEDRIVLNSPKQFFKAIIPYPQNKPSETKELKFLRDQFSEEFKPLGDVFRAIDKTRPRPSPITVAEVSKGQFDAVVAWAERSERLTASSP